MPALVWTILSYAGTALAAILAYEIVRSWVKRRLRRQMERGLLSFLQTPDLYQQSFKFTNKLVVKQILLADPEINAKIYEYARREKHSPIEVRKKVASYLEEIIPAFNLLTYYRVGYGVAKSFIHLLYDPVVDQERLRLLDRLPTNASPVYVINHRSNVDYVLLAYILAGRVSVSYAVGEWARVWPLEHLFKSFGSYLVRRGHKEDLYHKVLERYVQLQAKHGVAQALFPEGNLSRDGRLLPPKFGLLQFLSGVENDPDFHRSLVFIPVGVNYDWVLEDGKLIAEVLGHAPQAPAWNPRHAIRSGPQVFLKAIFGSAFRRWVLRRRFNGYASLSFAEPILLSDWMKEHGADPKSLGYEERKPLVQVLGQAILERIGRAVPATPVTMLSVALLDHPRESYTTKELFQIVGETRRELESKGVRIVVGREFQGIRAALGELERAHPGGEAELDDVARNLVRQEEEEKIVRLATDILRRQRILRRTARLWRVPEDKQNYVRYYANSLAHHLGRSYPIPPAPAVPEVGKHVAAPRPAGTAGP